MCSLPGDEVITGAKRFAEDVYVDGDIDVEANITINGVDISKVASTIVQLSNNSTTTVETPVRFLRYDLLHCFPKDINGQKTQARPKNRPVII